MTTIRNPLVIQGGMGFNISTWLLARIVSMLGGLGTISGVSLERVLATELQRGDVGGHFRRALAHFPYPANVKVDLGTELHPAAKMVLDAFFIEEGNPHGLQSRGIPFFTVDPPELLKALCVCANYAVVWLAKESHDNFVSINYLEKIAMPHVYAITGAMLAGVDYITMGAGIPIQIPEVINAIMEGKTVKYRVPVEGTTVTSYEMSFDPERFLGGKLPPMKRPRFLPIISSNALAAVLMQRLPEGSVYGFVIEEPTAGGHNAPPRGQFSLTAAGEPVYGQRDIVDYAKIAKLGLPFWIGGSKASPEKLAWALSIGAAGIQVGTAFALCEESGMSPTWKSLARRLAYNGTLHIWTDGVKSPTGFPFKVAAIPGTVFEPDIYAARERTCKHGALVTLYEKPDGSIGYRCPGEPVSNYLAKDGKFDDTIGRCCLCCGLFATSGLGDVNEAPIITLGDDVVRLMPLLMKHPDDSYSAADVFKYLGV